MLEGLLIFWAAWKFEVICGALLVAFPLLRARFRHNIIVAEFIRQATGQIAEAMEQQPDVTNDPKGMKRSAQKARRRKVRSRLAKEARKANRTPKAKKGNKKGGGKTK
jgi:hypothetical protein